MAHSEEVADKTPPPPFFFSEERYSAQCCLDAPNQTSVAGTQKCADGFSFYKMAEN